MPKPYHHIAPVKASVKLETPLTVDLKCQDFHLLTTGDDISAATFGPQNGIPAALPCRIAHVWFDDSCGCVCLGSLGSLPAALLWVSQGSEFSDVCHVEVDQKAGSCLDMERVLVESQKKHIKGVNCEIAVIWFLDQLLCRYISLKSSCHLHSPYFSWIYFYFH